MVTSWEAKFSPERTKRGGHWYAQCQIETWGHHRVYICPHFHRTKQEAEACAKREVNLQSMIPSHHFVPVVEGVPNVAGQSSSVP